MKYNEKYTYDILFNAVTSSHSIANVLTILGLRPTGSNYSHIKSRIKDFGIDTSHFTGKLSNSGSAHSPGPKPAVQVLIKRESGRRESSVRLRRAMIASGVEYKCASCGQGDVWNGKELRLQINHIDRNWLDNRIDNLEFLCPNCHTQTEGWSGSGGGTSLTSISAYSKSRRASKKQ